jgi:hypothetical protein
MVHSQKEIIDFIRGFVGMTCKIFSAAYQTLNDKTRTSDGSLRFDVFQSVCSDISLSMARHRFDCHSQFLLL